MCTSREEKRGVECAIGSMQNQPMHAFFFMSIARTGIHGLSIQTCQTSSWEYIVDN